MCLMGFRESVRRTKMLLFASKIYETVFQPSLLRANDEDNRAFCSGIQNIAHAAHTPHSLFTGYQIISVPYRRTD